MKNENTKEVNDMKEHHANQNEGDDDDKPLHPIDTGFAWVILASVWIISFVLIGIYKSYGLFFIEFIKTFESSVSATTLLTSLQTVVQCITALPVLSIYIKRYDTRKLAIFGCFMAALGYGLSSFTNSLEFLYFSQSFLLGVSNACVFGPNLVTLGKYFEKRRGLAFGITFSGNSLGGFALPYLFRYLFDEYGLRGGLLLTSGLALNTIVFSSLLRSTDFYKKRKRKSKKHVSSISDFEQTETLLRNNDEKDIKNSSYNVTSSQPSIPTTYSLKQNKPLIMRSMSHSPDRLKDTKYFNGSVENESGFTRYLSQGDIVSLSFQDVRMISKTSDENQISSSSTSCGGICKYFVDNDIFDCNIFRNKYFVCFLPAYMLGALTPGLAHIFIPTHAKDMGISDQEVAIIVSVISLADFCGRILVGYISDLARIKKRKLCLIIGSQLIIGIMMQLAIFYKGFWIFIVFAIIYGMVGGTLFTLFSPVLIDLIGLKNLGNGMMVLTTLQGGTIAGIAPVLGYLRDSTGSYITTFRCMGACSLGSVAILLVMEIITRMRVSRRKEDIKMEETC